MEEHHQTPMNKWLYILTYMETSYLDPICFFSCGGLPIEKQIVSMTI